MADGTSRAPDPARRAALAVAGVLVALAFAWALSNVGPRGPHVATVAGSHGIDAYDLFALLPLVLAIGVLVAVRRRGRLHRRDDG